MASFASTDALLHSLTPPLLTSVLKRTLIPWLKYFDSTITDFCKSISLGELCNLPSNDFFLLSVLVLLSAVIAIQAFQIRDDRRIARKLRGVHLLTTSRFPVKVPPSERGFVEVKMKPAPHQKGDEVSELEWDLPDSFAPLLSSPNLTVTGLESLDYGNGLRSCSFGDNNGNGKAAFGQPWYKPWAFLCKPPLGKPPPPLGAEKGGVKLTLFNYETNAKTRADQIFRIPLQKNNSALLGISPPLCGKPCTISLSASVTSASPVSGDICETHIENVHAVIQPPLPVHTIIPTLFWVTTMFEDRILSKIFRGIHGFLQYWGIDYSSNSTSTTFSYLYKTALRLFSILAYYISRLLILLENNFIRIELSEVSLLPTEDWSAPLVALPSPPSLSLAFSGVIHLSFFNLSDNNGTLKKVSIGFNRVTLPRVILPHINATLSTSIKNRSPFATADPLKPSALSRILPTPAEVFQFVSEVAKDSRVRVGEVRIELESWSVPLVKGGIVFPGGVRFEGELEIGGSCNDRNSESLAADGDTSSTDYGEEGKEDVSQPLWNIRIKNVESTCSHDTITFKTTNSGGEGAGLSIKQDFGARREKDSSFFAVDGFGSIGLVEHEKDGSPGRRGKVKIRRRSLTELLTSAVTNSINANTSSNSFVPPTELAYSFSLIISPESRIGNIVATGSGYHPLMSVDAKQNLLNANSVSFQGFRIPSGTIRSDDARITLLGDGVRWFKKRDFLKTLPVLELRSGWRALHVAPKKNATKHNTIFGEGGAAEISIIGGCRDANLDCEIEGVKFVLKPTGKDESFCAFRFASSAPFPHFPELGLEENEHAFFDGSGGGVIKGIIKLHLHNGNELKAEDLQMFGVDKSGGERRTLTTNGTWFECKLLKDWFVRLGKDVNDDEENKLVLHIPSDLCLRTEVLSSLTTMDMEGGAKCVFGWTMGGKSPQLYRTKQVSKKKVDILLPPLREGRFNFIVNSIGGVKITRAEILNPSGAEKTDLEHAHLFDWKFFNALIDPSSDPAGASGRLYDVFVNHKPTMSVVIECVSLLSEPLSSFLNHVMKAAYRARDIFKAEGVKEIKNAIPHANMARLFSLLLSNDTQLIDRLSPIIKGVIDGEGLDCEGVKELLQENLDGDWGGYEKWR